ncbi:MAG: putative kinase [Akkermansiaceae bacterium]|nr:putative kinase [Akkermansiaceae bacterium]
MGRRILVTGNAGSGKSTLVREIAENLRIPCHGLDAIVWAPGWRKTPAEERDRRILELIQGEAWVVDGVSFLAQAAADTVIFLDVPRRVCFWRVAKRNWRYLFRSRPGLPAGCPEILIVPALCRIIWNFPARVRPRILERTESGGGPKCIFQVKSRGDLDTFLTMMKTAGNKVRLLSS